MKPDCCKNKELTRELASTVEFLKLIAEENRLKILCLLRDGEKCVCDIWRFLDLPQNLASHHLKLLREFDIIESRKDGVRVYYSINKAEMSKYNSSLNHFLKSYEQ